MKLNKKFNVLIFTVVLIFSISIFVLAFPGYGHHRGMNNNYMNQGGYSNVQPEYNPLNLTDEQIALLREKGREYVDTNIELRQEMRKLNSELRYLITSNESEEEKIVNIQNKISDLQASLLDQRIAHWQQLQEVFTSEQLEIINKYRDEEGNRYNNFPMGPGMMGYGFQSRGLSKGYRHGMRNNYNQNNYCPYGF